MNPSIPNKNIFIEDLHNMFSNIKANGNLDMNSPMLWGHFFTHNEPSKLEAVIPALEKLGLRFVDIYLSDKDDPSEPDLFWLHMEEVRIHTPESLDQRNNELFIFAHQEGLDSYDGMDAGPVAQ